MPLLKNEWVRLFGSSKYDAITALCVANDGSLYAAGFSEGDLDGSKSNGDADAFLVKYNSDGSKAWSRLLGTSSSDEATALAIANDGSIYLAGSTRGNLGGQINNGDGDAFLIKYNGDGTTAWLQLIGTPAEDTATSLAVAYDGSIYLAGSTGGDLNGKTKGGGSDGYIIKFSSNGSTAWTQLFRSSRLGDSSNDEITSLATSADGTIFAAGISTDFDIFFTVNDAFAIRLKADGSEMWRQSPEHSIASSGTPSITAIDGNIIYFATAKLRSISDIGPRGIDLSLTEYNSDGSTAWTQLTRADISTTGGILTSAANNGSAYITGSTRNGDAFLSKINSDGSKDWAGAFGSSEADQARAISVSNDGLIYVAGNTHGDLGGQINSGEADGFIAKYSTNAISNSSPTGTPTISGTVSVGSTLTINTSGIRDPDNITGYTPRYRHLWETSSDGTNWSSLASADATDGNNTYTPTPAESNKRIRGSVSYEDGSGTTEVLFTASSVVAELPGLDLDGDGKTSLADSLLCMRSLLGTFPAERLVAGASPLNPMPSLRARACWIWTATIRSHPSLTA